jgi:hypothetical protein
VRLFSYVVRYDSGFAPNPFHGVCTLATCKPQIRKSANVDEWIVGTGSSDRRVQRGSTLVYAMRITEVLPRKQYWEDKKFRRKRPNLRGSSKHACGDNIYSWDAAKKGWRQLDSYHSKADGSPNLEHVKRDTGVDRVLVSSDFVYFGGQGPKIPDAFRGKSGDDICKAGPGYKILANPKFVGAFVDWIRSLKQTGCAGEPWDWVKP